MELDKKVFGKYVYGIPECAEFPNKYVLLYMAMESLFCRTQTRVFFMELIQVQTLHFSSSLYIEKCFF